jgi:hypothetical protein
MKILMGEMPLPRFRLVRIGGYRRGIGGIGVSWGSTQ